MVSCCQTVSKIAQGATTVYEAQVVQDSTTAKAEADLSKALAKMLTKNSDFLIDLITELYASINSSYQDVQNILKSDHNLHLQLARLTDNAQNA